VRNEDPPGKNSIPYEINEMLMMPELYDPKVTREDYEERIPKE
jgi:hypothetical protein